jgi:hypothetical protein
VFAEDGGGSGYLYSGVALALDPVLKRLGGLLRPMFLIGLGVSLMSKSGLTTGVLLLQQQ